jgi:hypothetical protein
LRNWTTRSRKRELWVGRFGRARSSGRVALRQEERATRILAKLVAQDAETARGVAELGGHAWRGEELDEVGAQRRVLAMGGGGGLEEGAREGS